MKRVLLTGAAGFIGMHVAQALLRRGDQVLGLDNLNDYYAVALKEARMKQLQPQPGFEFLRFDIADPAAAADLQLQLQRNGISHVVHLAAQAGVRHSLTHPHSYGQANLLGFLNMLEASRHARAAHFVYASSSSVYGGNLKMPFAEHDPVDQPLSLYAATKKANELMAHSYSHLYGLPTSGLRFFTVYGPWGRPDMAYFEFARAIMAGKPIKVFNQGQMSRDFTYIDDIVDGVLTALDNPAPSPTPYRVLNLGSHRPVPLLDFIHALELALGRSAQLDFQPMQAGDVAATFADVSAIDALRGRPLRPTPLAQGVGQFAAWYKAYSGLPGPAASASALQAA